MFRTRNFPGARTERHEREPASSGQATARRNQCVRDRERERGLRARSTIPKASIMTRESSVQAVMSELLH